MPSFKPLDTHGELTQSLCVVFVQPSKSSKLLKHSPQIRLRHLDHRDPRCFRFHLKSVHRSSDERPRLGRDVPAKLEILNGRQPPPGPLAQDPLADAEPLSATPDLRWCCGHTVIVHGRIVAHWYRFCTIGTATAT